MRAVGHQRTGSLSRTPSVRSIPSPRAGSPAKPSVSAQGNGNALLSPSRPSAARLGSPSKRQTLTLQPRTSLTRRGSIQSEAPSPTVGRSPRLPESPVLEPAPRLFPKTYSPGQGSPQPPQPSSLRRVSSPRPESEPEQPDEPPLPSVIIPPRPATPPKVDDTELQELRAKIRVLEAKRADDARHVRELETRLSEAESFVALRPKLQAKLNQQQTDLIATRRELADAQQLAQLAESRIVDTQEQLEMAMLDKEMAEERAEVAEADLEEAREKLAILEVETEHLREGGSESSNLQSDVSSLIGFLVVEGGGDTSVKESLVYIQLEKQNERLKEALIRLRDITQETEQDQRRRIAEMEKDVTTLDEIQCAHCWLLLTPFSTYQHPLAQYETTLIKLQNAETQIEDLKEQLDDALGAEDLLVQLTERNLMLGEVSSSCPQNEETILLTSLAAENRGDAYYH